MFVTGAVLIRIGQYYTDILSPPGAVFQYIFAPRQLCTDIILPQQESEGAAL